MGKAGKKVADTLGVMKKITELKTKAENFVMSKFLGIFGCKVRRRAFGLGDIGNAIKGAAGALISKAKDAAGAISSAAKAAAKVVCPVVKPMCPGACGAAMTAFKTAGTVLAATYHIPLNCLSGALEKGCNGLCKAICGRRRVMIRRNLGLPSMARLQSCAGTAGCALKVAGGGVMGAIAALAGGCASKVKKCVFGRRMGYVVPAIIMAKKLAAKKRELGHKKMKKMA